MSSSIVLIDPHEALREGLARLLTGAGWRVLGGAASLPEGAGLIASLHPRVALVDEAAAIEVPKLTRSLARRSPRTALVMYAADATAAGERFRGEPMNAIASKRGGLGELLATLAAAAATHHAASMASPSPAAPATIAPVIRDPVAEKPLEAAVSALSKREREVMELLSEGLTGDQIAARLHLSGQTVKTHVRNSLVKLRAANRTHAIAIAIRDGHISSRRGGPSVPAAEPLAA